MHGASYDVREVLRAVLQRNASSVIALKLDVEGPCSVHTRTRTLTLALKSEHLRSPEAEPEPEQPYAYDRNPRPGIPPLTRRRVLDA